MKGILCRVGSTRVLPIGLNTTFWGLAESAQEKNFFGSQLSPRPDFVEKSMIKKFEPLTAYAGFDVDKLTTNHRVIDFSIVDYMLKDSKKVREWLRHVKNHKDQGRAFRDVYELSMSEFVDTWAAWVLANYKPGMH